MAPFFTFFLLSYFIFFSANAVQTPILEFEGMKMKCTIRVTAEGPNNEVLANELIRNASYCLEQNWSVKRAQNISRDMNNRFEGIMQLVAQKLGRSILGFSPILQKKKNPTLPTSLFHAKRPEMPAPSQWTAALQTKVFEPEEKDPLLAYNAPQNPGGPESGTGSSGSDGVGYGGFPDGFAQDLPDEELLSSPVTHVSEALDVVEEIHHGAPATHPIQRLPTQPVSKNRADIWPLKATPENRFKLFLNQHLVRANILTPFTAGILLLLMHLSQETLRPVAAMIPLRRVRRRALGLA